MTERLLAVVMLLACGCGGEPANEVDPELFTVRPSYQQHIRPLFDRYCIGCHTSNGGRQGGVELDLYESAFSGRVHNACVAVRQIWIDRFADALMPQPKNPPVEQQPCDGWEAFSMPKGAAPHLTNSEQIILLRWVETGAQP